MKKYIKTKLVIIMLLVTTAAFGAFVTYKDGVTQRMNPDGTSAGFNLGTHTADPSTLFDGDAWINSTTWLPKIRLNGATTTLVTLSPPNALGALAIDVTKTINTKSVTADSTFTFSATPTEGTLFGMILTETGGTARTITIPSSYSLSRGTVTTFTLPANSQAWLRWTYIGGVYKLEGDPTTIDDLSADTTPLSTNYLENYDPAAKLHYKSTAAEITAAGFATLKAGTVEAGLFAADAGANDTYTATLAPAITAYTTGAHYRFKANTANTGAATINFNSVGAITIKKAAGGITTDLSDNDIRAGQWVDVVYDGTNMQMQSVLGNAGGSVTASSTDTFTNKTYDVSDAGNVFKQKGHFILQTPNNVDGTNCTISTTTTSSLYLRPTFSGSDSIDQAANYAQYRISVPTDIDTSAELRLRMLFQLGGNDTATHRYVASFAVANPAGSVNSLPTPGTAINLDFAGDGTGANGDLEVVGYTTLTGWAAGLTADYMLLIRIARDSNAAEDVSTTAATLIECKIEYGRTQ